MTNYNQTNIYRKQMNDLGLNTKQYASLIEMPYDVVKDIICDKEGDYSMEIKNLLRNTMFNKHQEIENDFDNTKIKAMQLKNEIDYLKWYDKEYNFELLKDKLNLKNIIQFEKNYCLKINEVKASHWTYQVLVAKKEYKAHSIDKERKLEFVKQLYDIIVNDNAEAYYNPMTTKTIIVTPIKHNEKINYVKWYKKFDIKQWKKENNIDNYMIGNNLNLSSSTTSYLVTKKRYSNKTLIKFYNYVMSIENNKTQNNDETDKKIDDTNDVKQLDNEEVKVFSLPNEMTKQDLDTNDATLDNSTNDKVDNSINQIEIDHDNNAILRMILANRLTDEEKLLIELFGGKIC